jgi:hypothetical protein
MRFEDSLRSSITTSFPLNSGDTQAPDGAVKRRQQGLILFGRDSTGVKKQAIAFDSSDYWWLLGAQLCSQPRHHIRPFPLAWGLDGD